ncbi:MAG: hypothetical protein K9J84_13980 [Bacteroidia bacterium]|nr:hypothetical protein [Bacteroidia bacterium]
MVIGLGYLPQTNSKATKQSHLKAETSVHFEYVAELEEVETEEEEVYFTYQPFLSFSFASFKEVTTPQLSQIVSGLKPKINKETIQLINCVFRI